jgi:hypothetical protein
MQRPKGGKGFRGGTSRRIGPVEERQDVMTGLTGGNDPAFPPSLSKEEDVTERTMRRICFIPSVLQSCPEKRDTRTALVVRGGNKSRGKGKEKKDQEGNSGVHAKYVAKECVWQEGAVK